MGAHFLNDQVGSRWCCFDWSIGVGDFDGKGWVGLIVVVSLWRVLRVVESVFELSDEAIEVQITSILCQLQLLQAEKVKLARIISEKDKIIEELQRELAK